MSFWDTLHKPVDSLLEKSKTTSNPFFIMKFFVLSFIVDMIVLPIFVSLGFGALLLVFGGVIVAIYFAQYFALRLSIQIWRYLMGCF